MRPIPDEFSRFAVLVDLEQAPVNRIAAGHFVLSDELDCRHLRVSPVGKVDKADKLGALDGAHVDGNEGAAAGMGEADGAASGDVGVSLRKARYVFDALRPVVIGSHYLMRHLSEGAA